MTQLDIPTARASFESLKEQAQAEHDRLFGEGATAILVGTATCGRSAGAMPVVESFKQAVAAAGLDAEVQTVGCIGHCYAEPMAQISRPGFPAFWYHHLNPIIARNLVEKFLIEGDPLFEFLLGAAEPSDEYPGLSDLPRYGKEVRRLLRRCGRHDPENIYQAVAQGAYAGLIRALEMGPDAVIAAVSESGLRGLGGAGFPTGRKWRACRDHKGRPHYIICNADEGDPGAFMDRTILESDPHAVIEGMIIGALAIGSGRGYVYVRAEYPLAVSTIQKAIADARSVGLLGKSVLGSGFGFDVEVFEGAGAFICGEETALIRSIEGRRGMPGIRPPFPVEQGLYGRPTVLDNVKSFANVGPVIAEGPDKFKSVGTETSKGTAVFALAGKIANPGLVEVPMGMTLKELIFDIGGGVPRGKQFKAVQIGGPSGGCLPESLLDTPVDFESLREVGAMMGSGGMVILDQDNCMVETARYFLEFTQRESCGKCTFCRIGTRHMLDILERITRGEGREEDIENLDRLASEIQDGSLCNLGKTAPNPVLTTLRFFRDEYLAHIRRQCCPAGVCKELTAYYILPDKCARGCDACVGSCPPEAIYTTSKRIKAIDQSLCVNCDSCVAACPEEYAAVVKISPKKDLPAAAHPPSAASPPRTEAKQ
jgi:NADH-quinone oxidoreductase subunit F